MSRPVSKYIQLLERQLTSGKATEHTHRPALTNLIETLDEKLVATNEPKRQRCGAPDLIITKNDVVVGYIETKDIGADLEAEENSEQVLRYRASLENLILTDYISFRWYHKGQLHLTASLGSCSKKSINSSDKGVEEVLSLINNFLSIEFEAFHEPKELATRMAALAKLIQQSILLSLQLEDSSKKLEEQLEGFKAVLLYDLTPEQFADMYAQTISYGLFAARANSKKGSKFSRRNAASQIPKTNPFLRKLFTHVTGPDLDDEPYCWAVDHLSNLLDRVDIQKLIKEFGEKNNRDAVIHFYETFLSEYDPRLREERGVYYTPPAIVSFITDAVDDVLKVNFGLKKGLADNSKVTIKVKGEKEPESIHKVLVLDPATGTGTFLQSVVDKIRHQFDGNEGAWSPYVSEHLLPRVFGFELLMAPYAVAHMKLGIHLAESGYDFGSDERLNIYLTNALEDTEKVPTLAPFSKWIAEEANAASRIKKDLPILAVVGNPPYSNFGQLNRNPSILALLNDYKIGLDDKKINLDDDFIKFIRWGQHRIQQTGQGVLAFITSHTYLNGLTHRRMRESLLETFDDLYIVDLHGNKRKKEVSPDGSLDENVFNIQQGVAITIFVKTKPGVHASAAARVHHVDIWGEQKSKYEWLENNTLKSAKWTSLKPKAPHFQFVPVLEGSGEEFNTYWSIKDIFPKQNSGLQTKRDAVAIQKTEAELKKVLENFRTKSPSEIRRMYELPADGRDWSIEWAKKDLQNKGKPFIVHYKPFDFRFSYYTGNSKGFLAYPRADLTQHLLKPNLALTTMRQLSGVSDDCQILVTKHMIADRTMYSTHGTPYVFPLYLYPSDDQQEMDLAWKRDSSGRVPNINPDFVDQVCSILKLKFVSSASGDLSKTFGPEGRICIYL